VAVDAVQQRTVNVLVTEVKQQDTHLPPVVGVNDPRADVQALLPRQPRPGRHAPVHIRRQRNGQARPQQRPPPRRHGAVLQRGQVVAGGGGGATRRRHRPRVQQLHPHRGGAAQGRGVLHHDGEWGGGGEGGAAGTLR